MDHDGRSQHSGADANRADGSEQAERGQQAAAEFGKTEAQGPQPGGAEAQHAADEALEAGEAWAAEPAEELLGAVSGNVQTDDDAEDEKGGVHDYSMMRTMVRLLGYRHR